ncbi:hypothetical protein AN478_10805 [Thiohalorhabdus denitrificans]|uniref:hypothetical protein n=1 Tax=Thiohalorhabdus denitrificans TaxID=381306 RepID=UPI0006D59007|nr:hypothetical protein [Thiohalorhabdus denitrificans]KPV39612.1 hypothetical protein AN478_10805 [Thiohalorhabdus denitrificans]
MLKGKPAFSLLTAVLALLLPCGLLASGTAPVPAASSPQFPGPYPGTGVQAAPDPYRPAAATARPAGTAPFAGSQGPSAGALHRAARLSGDAAAPRTSPHRDAQERKVPHGAAALATSGHPAGALSLLRGWLDHTFFDPRALALLVGALLTLRWGAYRFP